MKPRDGSSVDFFSFARANLEPQARLLRTSTIMVMADLIQAARERPAIAVVVIAAAVPVLVGGGLLTSFLLAPFLPFVLIALVRNTDASRQLPIAEQTSGISPRSPPPGPRDPSRRLSDSCHHCVGIFSGNFHQSLNLKFAPLGLGRGGDTSIVLRGLNDAVVACSLNAVGYRGL